MISHRETDLPPGERRPVSDERAGVTTLGEEAAAVGPDECPKKRNAAFRDGAMEVYESTKVEAGPSKKRTKTKTSILEELDYDDGVGGSKTDAIEEDECSKPKAKRGPKKKTSRYFDSLPPIDSTKAEEGPKKKTSRYFDSLSPKQGPESSLGRTDESTTAVAPPKRKGRKTPEQAKSKPINVVFGGQDEISVVTIESHCTEDASDLGEEPLLLTGKYDRRSMIQIRRFLSGFGRFIH